MSNNYSSSKPFNNDVTGLPPQVYAMKCVMTYILKLIGAGNLCALGAPDFNGTMMFLFFPHIKKDIEGDPEGIVGNVSNSKGEYSLVFIPLDAFQYFAVVGDSSLPGSVRGPAPIPLDSLKDSPWKDLENIFFGLFPCWIPFYFGQDIPEINILAPGADLVFKALGSGYIC